MRIVLVTEYFQHSVQDRQAELDESLLRNVSNSLIDEIILLIENKWTLPKAIEQSSKVKCIHVGGRLTFAECFEVINSIHREDTIFILANLDIYFDHSVSKLKNVEWDNRFVCLTRWNLKGYCGTHNGEPIKENDIQWNHEDSHDSWITSQPIKPELIKNAAFFMGIPGCDGKLCYCMQASGYVTSNPCEDVHSFHLHLSGGEQGYRTYEEKSRLPKPYGRVPKASLCSITKQR